MSWAGRSLRADCDDESVDILRRVPRTTCSLQGQISRARRLLHAPCSPAIPLCAFSKVTSFLVLKYKDSEATHFCGPRKGHRLQRA